MKFILDDKEVQLKDNKAYLFFYAPWMPFFKKMEKIILKMEEEYKIEFFCIDVDLFKLHRDIYKVSSIPEIVVVSGKEHIKINGYPLISSVRAAINKINNKGKNDKKK